MAVTAGFSEELQPLNEARSLLESRNEETKEMHKQQLIEVRSLLESRYQKMEEYVTELLKKLNERTENVAKLSELTKAYNDRERESNELLMKYENAQQTIEQIRRSEARKEQEFKVRTLEMQTKLDKQCEKLKMLKKENADYIDRNDTLRKVIRRQEKSPEEAEKENEELKTRITARDAYIGTIRCFLCVCWTVLVIKCL